MEFTRSVWKTLNDVPEGVYHFIRRAAVLFLIWKAVYNFVLLPLGEPDGWLVRRLGDATVATLNLCLGERRYLSWHDWSSYEKSKGINVSYVHVYRPGFPTDVLIFPPCNGLQLMVLSIGFILCFEGGYRRKTAFVISLLIGVFLINVIRCSLLTMIKTSHPVYFNFVHKYLFNLFAYSFIFLVWVYFVNSLSKNES